MSFCFICTFTNLEDNALSLNSSFFMYARLSCFYLLDAFFYKYMRFEVFLLSSPKEATRNKCMPTFACETDEEKTKCL